MTDLALHAISSELCQHTGATCVEHASLARLTSARIGGEADLLVVVNSADQLISAVKFCWDQNLSFFLLGGGSNVLVSDAGYRGVVIHNKCQHVEFIPTCDTVLVRAESGANLGLIARKAAEASYTGLEWAAGIPGTLGGAVYGNAGAHGSDIAANLVLADILHQDSGRSDWTLEKMAYGYRQSILKTQHQPAVILGATLKLHTGDRTAIKSRMEEYTTKRKTSQPAGASMGSIFKNPPGDHAGRLIEAVGLKGKRIGGAEISRLHANFIVNHENACSADIWELIRLARAAVQEHFGIRLELEIELVGEFMDGDS